MGRLDTLPQQQAGRTPGGRLREEAIENGGREMFKPHDGWGRALVLSASLYIEGRCQGCGRVFGSG